MRFDRAAVLPLLFFLSCSDGPTGPSEDPSVAFGTASLHLGEARSAFIVVRNTGQIAVGPIEVFAQPVMKAGLELPGVEVLSAPDEIPTLNPGDSAVIELTVALATMLQPGTYEAPLRARVQGRTLASAVLLFDVAVPPGLVGRIQITSAPDGLRQGDVAHFSAAVFDTLDQIVPDAVVTWSATPGSGIFFEPGVFVPYSTGVTRVIAASGSVADTLAYDVSVRSGRGDFTVVGHTPLLSRFTSDLWVHGDVAYTGTWGSRQEPGNMMYAWNVSGPDPELTDSVRIVAFTVDDVMIRADGKLAIITHEYASPSHAITLVDMSDPEHPTVAGEFHSDIVGAEWIGVHNAWLDGDYAYIVVDGATANRGLWILDVSDPANPVRVARFWGGSSFLHDVIVRDGLACAV